MTKAIQVKKPTITDAQIELIKKTVAIGATNDELKLFLYTANKAGLDPLTRQIHFVKRGGRGVVQTGIDGYRAIAERTGELAGIDDAEYDDENAVNPNKASVTVYRLVSGIRVAFTASARWKEYCPQAPNNFMWLKMPYLMLAKCAESLALRKAFPNDLSGIYTNEEMAQAEEPATRIAEESNQVNNSEMPYIEEETYVKEEEVIGFSGTPIKEKVLVPSQIRENERICDTCGKPHTGFYKKCLECWKAGSMPIKPVVNTNEQPF